MIQCYRNRKRLVPYAFQLLILYSLAAVVMIAQPKYRTFSQGDLAGKKAEKSGKRIGTIATFTFKNDSPYTATSLHVKFNSGIEAVQDSGGFTTLDFKDKKAFNASGRVVGSHDSVMMTFLFHKKDGNVKAEKWWWDTSGVCIGPKYKIGRASCRERV